ncbi:MinD/ParA family protein [Pseudonocardia sp. NPDC049635]|uniref:MinD/ParA family ATP-binding protein n=1 Tax=Pseudonocardia sp. NPDC049635 TaxID=3155506 RepID=UPI0033C70389
MAGGDAAAGATTDADAARGAASVGGAAPGGVSPGGVSTGAAANEDAPGRGAGGGGAPDSGAPAVEEAPAGGPAGGGEVNGDPAGRPAGGVGAEPGGGPSAARGAPAARGSGRAAARPSTDRPWRSSWDRDAAERDAADRAGRDDGAHAGGSRAASGAAPRRPRWTAPEAVEARSGQHRRGDGSHGGLDLTPHRVTSPRRPPESGWRRMVYLLTGGLVNPGESPAELHRRDLVARLNRPLLNAHKIAMLSLKGGVGKTTVTATLGATFASHRGDRVVAVDANPDRGTLSQKIPLETTATVRHLLRDSDRVRRYTDVRAYTSQGQSRLEVLASEQDPAVSEAFSEDDYRRAVDLLEHFYNLVLTDCGTGLMHSAMYGVLGMADQLVIVSSGSIDGARSASATLDWLDAHGYGNLVRNAVVVINSVYRRAGGGVDLDRVAEHFAGRCRAVVRVPFDPHLEEGAEIDLDRLEEPTRIALLELAAAVADGFPV